jgi:hypothetical protein
MSIIIDSIGLPTIRVTAAGLCAGGRPGMVKSREYWEERDVQEDAGTP